jgi:hypothetical protein
MSKAAALEQQLLLLKQLDTHYMLRICCCCCCTFTCHPQQRDHVQRSSTGAAHGDLCSSLTLNTFPAAAAAAQSQVIRSNETMVKAAALEQHMVTIKSAQHSIHAASLLLLLLQVIRSNATMSKAAALEQHMVTINFA